MRSTRLFLTLSPQQIPASKRASTTGWLRISAQQQYCASMLSSGTMSSSPNPRARPTRLYP